MPHAPSPFAVVGLIKPSVTHELTARACAAIAADGHNPGFPRVYERIGRKGSARVVQNPIAEWRRKAVAGERRREGVPQELVAAADRMADELFKVAIERAEARLAEAGGLPQPHPGAGVRLPGVRLPGGLEQEEADHDLQVILHARRGRPRRGRSGKQ